MPWVFRGAEPTVKIDVKVDYKAAVAQLNDAARKQLPFHASKMVNQLALDVQKHVKSRLPEVFKSPVPFTVNSLAVRRDNTKSLVAEVYFKNSAPSGGEAARRDYLYPGTDQTTAARKQKVTERLLSEMGVLPPGWVTVPGRAIMDANGNAPGSYYKQVIRELQIKVRALKPRTRASTKRAARMGVESEFFYVAPGKNSLGKGGGWLPPGIYRRTGFKGDKLVQYFKFVRKAGYVRRLDFEAEARKAVDANLPRRYAEMLSLLKNPFVAR